MRQHSAAFAYVTVLVACATTGPATAPMPVPAPVVAEPPDHDAAPATDEPSPMTTTTLDAPERSRPPSTASYEEAISTPEPVDINDDRVQLTDVQLTSPMRGALNGCRLPAHAKVTIKTAVQYGRAIGVTVDIHFEKPRSRSKPEAVKPKPEAAKAERKAIAKIAACVDQNVRMVVWPPSRRRDSFTMEF